MKWYLVWWSMLIPSPLLEGLRGHIDTNEAPDSISDRPCDLIIPGTAHVIDYPGMCSTNRHLHTLELEGLTVKIPATDFYRVLDEVKSLPILYEGGIPHYRMYSMIRCLCMTSSLREQLIQEMSKQLPAAVEIADMENRQFNEAMGATKNISISTEDT